jgi:hypothetical protein
MRSVNFFPATLFALGTLTSAGNAGAGSGYFTTYNSEVERGELELMLMSDFTQPSRFRRDSEGMKNYGSHMLELEYGVTDQLAAELMVEWFEEIGNTEFTGVRLEGRYRLFKDPVPLNPMLYLEYEDLDPRTRYKMEVSGWVQAPYAEHEASGRERIVETRLVLSDHVGPVEIALNWLNETDLHDGTTAFGYAVGVSWMSHRSHREPAGASPRSGYGCPMHPDVHLDTPGACPHCGMALVEASTGSAHAGCSCPTGMKECGCAHCAGHGGRCTCSHAGAFGVGLEMFGALGDTRSFGLSPARQEHYLGPIGMVHLTSRWMMHAQVAIGLTESSDQLVRFNLGYEF